MVEIDDILHKANDQFGAGNHKRFHPVQPSQVGDVVHPFGPFLGAIATC